MRYLPLILALLSGSFQNSNNLSRLEIYASQGGHALYNPNNGWLVFHGTGMDDKLQVVQYGIFLKNLKNFKESNIEPCTLSPAVGWTDSSRVLIYKYDRNALDTGKHGKRSLFTYNIFDGTKTFINEIPLRVVRDKMVVDGQWIVYQTGIDKTSRIFRYNLLSKQTIEYSKVAHLDIGNTGFQFRKKDQMLAFIELKDDFFKLNIVVKDSVKSIITSKEEITNLSFDSFKNRLFFVVQKVLFDSHDSSKWVTVDVLKSYDFESKELITHHAFKEDVICERITSYTSNSLIVSLASPVNESSEVVMGGINIRAPKMDYQLFVLRLQE